MPAPMSLSDMVADMRAELGHSTNPNIGQNMEDTLKYYLRRTQKELYVAHDWPQFIKDEVITFVAGDRFLTDATLLDYEQYNQMWCRQGSEWYEMLYGIDPDHYSLYNPDNDVRGWPLQRWRFDPAQDQVELWPIPSVDGEVMVRGQYKLQPLEENSQMSMLDGQLLVLYASANLLARQKAEDAALVLQEAQQYLTSLLKQFGSQKRHVIRLVRSDGGRRPRPGLDYIPRSGS